MKNPEKLHKIIINLGILVQWFPNIGCPLLAWRQIWSPNSLNSTRYPAVRAVWDGTSGQITVALETSTSITFGFPAVYASINLSFHCVFAQWKFWLFYSTRTWEILERSRSFRNAGGTGKKSDTKFGRCGTRCGNAVTAFGKDAKFVQTVGSKTWHWNHYRNGHNHFSIINEKYDWNLKILVAEIDV